MAWDQVAANLYRHQTLDWACQLEGGVWVLKDTGGLRPTLVMPADLPPPLAAASSAAAGILNASWSMTTTAITIRAGSVLTVKGAVVLIPADVTIDFSGGGYAAGWYFAAVSNAGGFAVRKVQASEIVADTERYSPTPAFDPTINEYFPAVFTPNRAVGAIYWNGTSAILHFYAYGSGRRKNDSRVLALGSQAASSSGRARFGAAPTYQHGDDSLSWSDDATNGTRLTVQRPGLLFVTVTGYQTSGANQSAIISRNQAAPAMNDVPNLASKAYVNNSSEFVTGAAPVQPGDVVGFHLGGGAALANVAEAKLIARLQELP